jgi:hypothetical protein
MSDFEVLPIGTTQRIKDLEAEVSVLRKAENEVTDAISTGAAIDIKNFVECVEAL